MARTHLRKRILLPLLVLSLTTGVFLAVQLAEADQDRWDLSPEVQADLLAPLPQGDRPGRGALGHPSGPHRREHPGGHHPHRQPPPRSLLSVLRTDDRNFSGQAWLLEREEMKGTHYPPGRSAPRWRRPFSCSFFSSSPSFSGIRGPTPAWRTSPLKTGGTVWGRQTGWLPI